MLSDLLAIITGVLNHIFVMIGAVSGTNSFPQPLLAEEEQEYLGKYKMGSEEARNILIERNLRLVAHIVKKYSNTRKESDDLISIGTVGLIKAITTFDQDKGIRLATYAAKCIENEILMHIRATKKIQSEVYLQDTIGVDREGNEITLMDVIGCESESVTEKVELKMLIKRLYNKMKAILKKREKLVLELRYGLVNGTAKTQREIAQMLGISRSYVSRIEKKAIKKLSSELKTESN